MTAERRSATLLAFASVFAQTALADALDLLALLITDISHAADTDGQNTRLRTLRDLDAAALQLGEAIQVILDESVNEERVRRQVFSQIPRERLVAAAPQVATLARPPDDHYYPELVERYRRVRLFLPALLRTVACEGTQPGPPLRAALHFLRHLTSQSHPDMQQAPLAFVPAAWRRLVQPRHEPQADRRAYTLCAIAGLQESLRRDVLVARSERWGDPRVKLLQGAQWATLRPQVCRALGRQDTPEPELHALGQQLEAAYQRTVTHFSTTPAVRVEQVNGRDTLTVTGLDQLDAPPSLVTLRAQVHARLPRVDLPPRSYWQSTRARALLMNSPPSGKGQHGWRICPPACVPSSWQKPVTSDWSRASVRIFLP
jgi:hypothetical protein